MAESQSDNSDEEITCQPVDMNILAEKLNSNRHTVIQLSPLKNGISEGEKKPINN